MTCHDHWLIQRMKQKIPISPHDLDTLVAQTRLLTHRGATKLCAWSVDFSNAYKTIGLHESSHKEDLICFVDPVSNVPHKAQISAHPFGSCRSPANWGRVVTFLRFVAIHLLGLSVGAFVGDVYCAEPGGISTSGFWAFKRLFSILGFPTSDKNDQPPSRELVLLGDPIVITDSGITASIRPDRVSKLRSCIAPALRADSLTPSAAIKLRGKLGFYTSPHAGKLGRGTMGPLIRRQYAQHTHQIDMTLKRNLLWRYCAIGKIPPRITPFAVNGSVGAHTEAQGFGHIAAAHALTGRVTVSLRLPDWLISLAVEDKTESPIFIYELCAAILMACIAITWPRTDPRTCVLCVDNKAALADLVKGGSSSHLGTLLVTLFWMEPRSQRINYLAAGIR